MAPTFEQLGRELGELVAAKNLAYGNAAVVSAQMLRLAFPDGVKPEQYEDLLLITRIFDKILRIANDKGAFGESPFFDLAGYSLIGWRNDLREREGLR